MGRGMRLGARAWLTGLLCILLASCKPSPSSTIASSTTSDVKVELGISGTVLNSITRIVSPFSSAPVGQNLDMSALADQQETLLIAVDAQDNIFLATLASKSDGAHVSMTPSSTALALARLMAGSLPSGVTEDALEQAIKSSAEFSNLTNLISSALASGTPPINYAGIAASIDTTLAQAFSAVSGSVKPQELFANSTTVSLPLPYSIVNDGPEGFFSISVADADAQSGGVHLKNGFPIKFAAFGSSPDGSPSIENPAPIAIDGLSQIALPPSSLISTGDNIAVSGNGSSWNLTVYQTPLTRTSNGILLSQSFLEFSLSYTELSDIANDCAGAITTSALGSSVVATWSTELSVDAAWTQLRNSLSSLGTWTAVGSAALKCGADRLPFLAADKQSRLRNLLNTTTAQELSNRLSVFLNPLKNFIDQYAKALVRPYRIATTVYDATTLGTQAYFIYHYWSYRNEVGVCEGPAPPSGVLSIVNCAKSLALDHTPLTLNLGDGFRYTVTAEDQNGATTLTPRNLVWSSSDPSYVSVDQQGRIAGLAKNTYATIITVTDPITGSKGQAAVYVGNVSAAISVTPSSIELGGSATISWSSVYATTCSATGDWSGALAVSGSKSVTPPTVGTFNYGITCNDDAARGMAVSSTNLTAIASQQPTVAPLAWVKYENRFETVYVGLDNQEARENVDKIAEMSIIRANNQYPSVGDQKIIQNPTANQLINGGDYWASYPTTFDQNGRILSPLTSGSIYRDWTIQLSKITEIVSDPHFTPLALSGGDVSITTQVFTYDNRYVALQTYHFPQFTWVQVPAIILDKNGNGYDDNGLHDKQSN